MLGFERHRVSLKARGRASASIGNEVEKLA
jgi:hypothetical protein